MLGKKICLQRLFESAFCTALISELVRKRIPDGMTGDRKWPTAKCAAVLTYQYFSVVVRDNNNNNNNNNLRLITVKTNHWTLHTLYNTQQSATHGSNNMTHRLSRRTATTTRFSPEGIGCQKQTAPGFHVKREDDQSSIVGAWWRDLVMASMAETTTMSADALKWLLKIAEFASVAERLKKLQRYLPTFSCIL